MSKKKHNKKHRSKAQRAKERAKLIAREAEAARKKNHPAADAEAKDLCLLSENATPESDTPKTEAELGSFSDAPGDVTEKRKKKRHFPVFWTLYLLFIAAFAVSLWYGVRFLTGILSEYESVQPEYAAEAVFAEHFKEPDVASLIEMSSTEYALFETHERVIEYLSSQVEGKEITYSESSAAGEEGVFTYNVFCGGARFAVFRIEQGQSVTDHGFPIYVLKDVRLTFSLPDNAYDLVIPEGYTLYANGVEVPESFVSGEPEPTDAYKITSGVLGVRYISYRVDGFLSTPEFTVTDRKGEACELEYDGDDGVGRITVESVTLRIPEGYTAYIGDGKVGDEYLTENASEASAYNEYLREEAAPLNYVSYAVHGFLEMPTVTVKDPKGVECEVRFDEKTNTYESLPAFDAGMRESYERWVLGAFEKLTLYLQLVPGTEKADVIGYFDTSSDIWRAYASIDPDWNYEAYDYEFTDESASDFIVYDEVHFSCRVKLHYTGYRGAGTHEDVTDKIVFFRRIGARYYIYNMVNSVAVTGLGARQE